MAMTIVSRRSVFGLAAGAAALVPVFAHATAALSPLGRELAFYNIHTSETTRVLYFDNGKYVPDALESLNHFLRDWRTGDIHTIDPALFDQLHDLQALTEGQGAFTVICGYRSPKTNEALHERSSGVATHSQHLLGKAMDLNLPGKDLSHLHAAALSLKAGGVGYYPNSDFIHMDTGPVRQWT